MADIEITQRLEGDYIGSAYNPQVAIAETDEGHVVSITYMGPSGLDTVSYTVPDWSEEEAARAEAEAKRVQGEANRAIAENERKQAEDGRAAAEAAREAAESARASAETARESAETEREQASAQAVDDAEAATAAADSAASTAATAATNADAKAQAAEAAAGNATTAAAAATSAAGDASTAAAAANTASGNATDAATAANAAASAASSAATSASNAASAANTAADAATAAAESIEDELAAKADKRGVAPQLLAGTSRTILSASSEGTFLSRACLARADGLAEISEVRGNTVVWNQLATPWNGSSSGLTYSAVDGAQKVSGTAVTSGASARIASVVATIGHKYAVFIVIKSVGAQNAVRVTPVRNQAELATNAIVDTAGWSSGDRVGIRVWATENAVADIEFYPHIIDLTQMYGAGNEPTTVAEFEAVWGTDYKPYSAPRLLDTNIAGIKTLGEWVPRAKEATAKTVSGFAVEPKADNSFMLSGIATQNAFVRFKLAKPVKLTYGTSIHIGNNAIDVVSNQDMTTVCFWRDSDPINSPELELGLSSVNRVYTPQENSSHIGVVYSYIGFHRKILGTGPTIEVAPFFSPQSSAPIDERAFPEQTLRGIGTAQDVMTGAGIERHIDSYTFTGNESITLTNWQPVEGTYAAGFPLSMLPNRKAYDGSAIANARMVDLPTISYLGAAGIYNGNIGFVVSTGLDDTRYSVLIRVPSSVATNNAELLAWLTGKTLYYEVTTPTTETFTAPIDLTYTVQEGGTEAWIVPEGDMPTSAAPTALIAYPEDAADVRDDALSAIAPVENGLASANYAVGDYLVRGGMLYRVTTAIAAGESIPASSISATTVAALIKALQ